MSASVLALAFCFAGVFCLTPLAVYLLWLAGMNRKPRPTVISAWSDFLALIGGLSGFLIFGGPLVVTAVQSNARYWTRGNFEQLRTAWEQEKGIWLAVAGGYVCVVVGAVIVGLIRRKNVLSVYGAEPNGLMATVHAAVSRFLKSKDAYGDLVQYEPYYGMSHGLVKIVPTDRNQSQEIERVLRQEIPHSLPAVTTPAGWIHMIAVSCAIGSFCSLGLVFLYTWLQR